MDGVILSVAVGFSPGSKVGPLDESLGLSEGDRVAWLFEFAAAFASMSVCSFPTSQQCAGIHCTTTCIFWESYISGWCTSLSESSFGDCRTCSLSERQHERIGGSSSLMRLAASSSAMVSARWFVGSFPDGRAADCVLPSGNLM